jgi:hypothetical protein
VTQPREPAAITFSYTLIWPLPDDLPHAAGVGDLDRVKSWFDDKGQPALGDPGRHHRNVRPGAHGIDLTIEDHLWGGTAAGWAWHAANDQAMYKMLTDAEEERKRANKAPDAASMI